MLPGPFRHLSRTTAFVAAVVLPLLFASPPAAADPVEPIEIALIGFNDFHESISDPATVEFAGAIEKRRAEHGEASTLLLSAGDILREGGDQNPASVGYLPTLCVLNALELDANAVGNHEFHYGALTTSGYATPLKTTIATTADFPFVSANILKSSIPQFPAHETFDVAGVKVAVIGATTRDTPSLDFRHFLWGLKFTAPVAAVNATAASLKALPDPPDIIVAVFHETASATEGGLTGDPVRIYNDTSADVDAIFSGHVHKQGYLQGPVPGEPGKTRPIIQSQSHGLEVSEVVLSIDPVTKDVISYTAQHFPPAKNEKPSLIATYPRAAAVDDIITGATPCTAAAP